MSRVSRPVAVLLSRPAVETSLGPLSIPGPEVLIVDLVIVYIAVSFINWSTLLILTIVVNLLIVCFVLSLSTCSLFVLSSTCSNLWSLATCSSCHCALLVVLGLSSRLSSPCFFVVLLWCHPATLLVSSTFSAAHYSC